MNEYINKWLFDPMVGKFVFAIIGTIVIYLLFEIFQKSIVKYVKAQEKQYHVRKIIKFFGYFIIILFVANVFSDKLGQLTVAFGVAGAGIAFAMQEVIVSVAGWVAISLGNFYKVGDRVKLGGIKGDVIDIGVLRTTIMECGEWVDGDLYNGRIDRVANSFVFKEPVYNYSGDFPFLWDEIVIPVRYGSDYKLTREILLAIGQEITAEYVVTAKEYWDVMVKKYLIEKAQIDPMVTMIANDNWVEFTLRYVVDFKSRRTVKDQLFVKILDKLDEIGKKIQLASATFEVVGIPTIRMDTSDKDR